MGGWIGRGFVGASLVVSMACDPEPAVAPTSGGVGSCTDHLATDVDALRVRGQLERALQTLDQGIWQGCPDASIALAPVREELAHDLEIDQPAPPLAEIFSQLDAATRADESKPSFANASRDWARLALRKGTGAREERVTLTLDPIAGFGSVRTGTLARELPAAATALGTPGDRVKASFLERVVPSGFEPALVADEIIPAPKGGRALLRVSGAFVVVDTKHWQVQGLTARTPGANGAPVAFEGAAWAPDGKHVIAWSNADTRSFDARTAAEVASRAGSPVGRGLTAGAPMVPPSILGDRLVEVHPEGLVRWSKLETLEVIHEEQGSYAQVDSVARRVLLVRDPPAGAVRGASPSLFIYDLESAKLLTTTRAPQGTDGWTSIGDKLFPNAAFSTDGKKMALATGDIALLDIASLRWTTLKNPSNRYVPGVPGALGQSRWDRAYFSDNGRYVCGGNAAGAFAVATPERARAGRARTCLVPEPKDPIAIVADLPIGTGRELEPLRSQAPLAVDAARLSPSRSLVAYIDAPVEPRGASAAPADLALVIFDPAADLVRKRIALVSIPAGHHFRGRASQGPELRFGLDERTVHVRIESEGMTEPEIDATFDVTSGERVPNAVAEPEPVAIPACRFGQILVDAAVCG